MDINEFTLMALRKGWATADELESFTTQWQSAHDAGAEGFGKETTLGDWLGSLDGWRRLMIIVRAARLEDPILAARLDAYMSGKGPVPEFSRITPGISAALDRAVSDLSDE